MNPTRLVLLSWAPAFARLRGAHSAIGNSSSPISTDVKGESVKMFRFARFAMNGDLRAAPEASAARALLVAANWFDFERINGAYGL